MPSQTINNHNQAKYTEFEFALDQVRVAFDEVSRLVRALNEGKTTGERFEGWQVPSKADVKSITHDASTALDVLRTAATKRKTELIARSWRP
jgi:phage terminase large subunit